MPPETALVAFDTGLFVLGPLQRYVRARHGLVDIICLAARRRAFRLLVLDAVFQELLNIAAERSFTPDWQDTLLGFLLECETVWPHSSPASVARLHHFTSILQDPDDAPIAAQVEEWRPDYFIHCNPSHWGRMRPEHLGGVSTCTPEEFLRSLGYEIPPPPRRQR